MGNKFSMHAALPGTGRGQLPLTASNTLATAPEQPSPAAPALPANHTAPKHVADAGHTLLQDAAALSGSLQKFRHAFRQLKKQLPPAQRQRLEALLEGMENAGDFVAHSPQLLDALQGTDLPQHTAPSTASIWEQAASTTKATTRNIVAAPHTQLLALSFVSTGLKTAAWYAQTVIPDGKLLAHPAQKNAQLTAIKTAISWAIALAEYIPITLANRRADHAGIHLAGFRGVIEAMDLGWFLGFLKLVKHAPLRWPHYLGLGITGAGCAVMNQPSAAGCSPNAHEADLEGHPVTASQLRTCQSDVAGLLGQLNGPVCAELALLQADLQTLCGRALPPLDSQPVQLDSALPTDQTQDMLSPYLKRLDHLLLAVPHISDALIELRANLQQLAQEAPQALQKVFAGGFLVGEIIFGITGAVLLAQHKTLPAALALSAAATGVKTVAWYAHTVVSDDKLLPEAWTPSEPKSREWVYSAVKVAMSWGIALFEYIPLTMAHRSADQEHLNLSKIRGVIEAMDLVWMALFMRMVKGDKLQRQHIAGLVLAGVGVAVANAL
jgi:uncharacterized protein (DUF486 family)